MLVSNNPDPSKYDDLVVADMQEHGPRRPDKDGQNKYKCKLPLAIKPFIQIIVFR
jgi:hypothetical protein